MSDQVVSQIGRRPARATRPNDTTGDIVMTATVDTTEATTATTEETTAMADQTAPVTTRAQIRSAAIDAAVATLAAYDAPEEIDLADVIGSFRALVAAVGPKAKVASGPRATLAKAEPADVAAYFASTGMTRKEIAGAAGVSTSVIATVQNVKGDRWSAVTFAAKRTMIDAWMIAHADQIAARVAADAAKVAEAEAKVAARAARAAAPKAAPKAKASGKAKAAPAAKAPSAKAKATPAKAGRPSAARRAANRAAKA